MVCFGTNHTTKRIAEDFVMGCSATKVGDLVHRIYWVEYGGGECACMCGNIMA